METSGQIANRRKSVSRLAIVESLSIMTMLIGMLTIIWYIIGLPDPKMAFATAIGLASIGYAVLTMCSMVDRRGRRT
jgi:hypothetical protein